MWSSKSIFSILIIDTNLFSFSVFPRAKQQKKFCVDFGDEYYENIDILLALDKHVHFTDLKTGYSSLLVVVVV